MKKRRIALAAFLVAVSLSFTGCFESSTPADTTSSKSVTTNETSSLDFKTAGAKGIINVIVVDRYTRLPISGVTVSNGAGSAVTDANGNVQFKNVDIGGASTAAVPYYLAFTKTNYTAVNLNQVSFSAETVKGNETNEAAKIDTSAATNVTISNDSGKLIVGTYKIILNNATQSVYMYMDELVTLKGTLALPSGVTPQSAKVLPLVDFGQTTDATLDYDALVPFKNLNAQDFAISNGKIEYTIKGVPRVPTAKFKLKVYLDGKSYADYYYEPSTQAINLETIQPVAGATAADQRILPMPNVGLSKYFNVTGTVYADAAKTTAIGAGAVVKLTNAAGAFEVDDNLTEDPNTVATATYRLATTDSTGAYAFHELKANLNNTPFGVQVLDFDKDGDGVPEFINSIAFNDIVVGLASNGNTQPNATGSSGGDVTKNLFFDGAYDYTIQGLVETGKLGHTTAGVKVALVTSDSKMVATTTTDASGVYKFEHVKFRNVKCVAYGIDTDGDGVYNFGDEAFAVADMSTATAALSSKVQNQIIAATKPGDVGYIFLAANSAEDDYSFFLAGSNFVGPRYNAGATTWDVYTSANLLNPLSTLTITLDKAIDPASLDEVVNIDHLLPVALLDSSNNTVAAVPTISADGKTITITPMIPLTDTTYKVALEKRLVPTGTYKYLAKVAGYDVAGAYTAKVDVDSYKLSLLSSSFARPDLVNKVAGKITLAPIAVTSQTALTLTFNKPVSAKSETDIINKGEKVVELYARDAGDYKVAFTEMGVNYAFNADRTVMTITLPDNRQILPGSYDVKPNASLLSDAAYTLLDNAKIAANSTKYATFVGSVGFGTKYVVDIDNDGVAEATGALPLYVQGEFIALSAIKPTVTTANIDWNTAAPALTIPVATYANAANLSMNSNVNKFKVYAKTGNKNTTWKEVGTLNASAVTKTQIKNDVVPLTTDLTQLTYNNGATAVYDFNKEGFGWGETVYVTVVPVDINGHEAALPLVTDTTKVTTIKDNVGVSVTKLAYDSNYGVGAASYTNSVEDGAVAAAPEKALDPAATNRITLGEKTDLSSIALSVTGVNPNVGLTISGITKAIVEDSTLVAANNYTTVDFTVSPTAKFTVATAGAAVTTITVDTTKGMYSGMSLYRAADNTVVTVDRIQNDTTVVLTGAVSVLAGDVFVIAQKDNANTPYNEQLYTRYDYTANGGNSYTVTAFDPTATGSLNGDGKMNVSIFNTADLVSSAVTDARPTNNLYQKVVLSNRALVGKKVGDTLNFRLKDSTVQIARNSGVAFTQNVDQNTHATDGDYYLDSNGDGDYDDAGENVANFAAWLAQWSDGGTILLDVTNNQQPLKGFATGYAVQFCGAVHVTSAVLKVVTFNTDYTAATAAGGAPMPDALKDYSVGNTLTFRKPGISTTYDAKITAIDTSVPTAVVVTLDTDLSAVIDNTWIVYTNPKNISISTLTTAGTRAYAEFLTVQDLSVGDQRYIISQPKRWYVANAYNPSISTTIVEVNDGTAKTFDNASVAADNANSYKQMVVYGDNAPSLASTYMITGLNYAQVTEFDTDVNTNGQLFPKDRGILLNSATVATDTTVTVTDGYHQNTDADYWISLSGTDSQYINQVTTAAYNDTTLNRLAVTGKAPMLAVADTVVFSPSAAYATTADDNNKLTVSKIESIELAGQKATDATRYWTEVTFGANAIKPSTSVKYAPGVNFYNLPTVDLTVTAKDTTTNTIKTTKDELTVNTNKGAGADFDTTWIVK